MCNCLSLVAGGTEIVESEKMQGGDKRREERKKLKGRFRKGGAAESGRREK